MAQLKTTRAVFDALGGVNEVAGLTENTYNTAWNWTTWDHFPPETYCALAIALREKGHRAPPSLWRMVGYPPKRRREANGK